MNKIPSILEKNSLWKQKLQAQEFDKSCITGLNKKLETYHPELVIITPWRALASCFTHWQMCGLRESWIQESDVKAMMWVSGSVGDCLYWSSGQFNEWGDIWLNLLPDNTQFLNDTSYTRYISWLISKRISWILNKESAISLLNDNVILHLSELIHHFRNNKTNESWEIHWIKFDFSAFMSSKVTVIITLRNAKTGRSVYFSNHNIEGAEKIQNEEELWNVVEATKTIPIIAWWPVKIREEFYFDGSFADPLQLGISDPFQGKKWTSTNKITSEDGININKNILPIVLFPTNIHTENTELIQSLKKQVFTLLFWSQIGDMINVSQKIYSSHYLKWLRQLAIDWEIVLMHNFWKIINPFDNSHETMHQSYHSWKQAVIDTPITSILVDYVQKKRP